MRGAFNRRTATKVKDGRVQRKNRRTFTSHQRLVIDRESPGRSRCHVVSKRDILAFIDIIPDWERLSVRLERIVLSADDEGFDGFYEFFDHEETGAIFLTAWDENLWMSVPEKYFSEHSVEFERLGVS